MVVTEHGPEPADGAARYPGAQLRQLTFHKGPYEVSPPLRAFPMTPRQVGPWEAATKTSATDSAPKTRREQVCHLLRPDDLLLDHEGIGASNEVTALVPTEEMASASTGAVSARAA